MNALFNIVASCSLGIIGFIVWKHFAQKNKAAHFAGLVTQNIKHTGGKAMVQADNSIAIMIDNKVVDVIPAERVEGSKGVIDSKSNEFTISSKNIYTLIKQCIRYMVEMQNSS